MTTDYAALVEEARGYLLPGDEPSVEWRMADAVEALAAENARLRSVENLLAWDALALSQHMGMSLDQAAAFIETLHRQATDWRHVLEIKAENKRLQAAREGGDGGAP